MLFSRLIHDCDLTILLCCMKARSEEVLLVQLTFELHWYQRQRLRQALLGADEREKKAGTEFGCV